MKRLIVLTGWILMSMATLYGQSFLKEETETDTRLRVGAHLAAKLNRRWEISLEEDFRLKNNFSAVDRLLSSFNVSYKVTDWLKVEPQYTLIYLQHDGKKSTDYENYWQARHRVALNILGSIKYRNWKFSLRERPQFILRTDSINPMENVKCQWELRTKLEAEYSFRSVPVKPYAFIELSNTLNTPDRFTGLTEKGSETINYKLGNYISKMRYSVGVKYRFNRKNSIDFFYRLDAGKGYNIHITSTKGYLKSITEEPYVYHILGLFYCFDL